LLAQSSLNLLLNQFKISDQTYGYKEMFATLLLQEPDLGMGQRQWSSTTQARSMNIHTNTLTPIQHAAI
jgi:hypothetical protein